MKTNFKNNMKLLAIIVLAGFAMVVMAGLPANSVAFASSNETGAFLDGFGRGYNNDYITDPDMD